MSVFSDDRFRGVSISDGRPVGILDLSYDASDGLYATLSGSVVLRSGGLRPLGAVFNAGYARRLRPGLSLDAGIVHSEYSHYSGVGSRRKYTEVYAGLAGKILGARVSVSPDYLGVVQWTLHGEVYGHVDVGPATYLEGEVGALIPLRQKTMQGNYHVQLDTRAGVAHRIGRVTLHAAVTSRTGSTAIYDSRSHGRTAVVLGISTAL